MTTDTSNAERMSRTRVVAADAPTVFAFLANPAMHQHTEPDDWVRDAIDPEPIKAVGQIFGMNMGFPQSGEPYVMHNRVTVFEADKTLEWEPGQLDEQGELGVGGWLWRYDLAPADDGTEVTLSYDWSATPQEIRDEIGGLPAFEPEFLEQSLSALQSALARDLTH